MIDEVEVIVYREVYYEYVKPMLKAGKSTKEIESIILPILEGYGWTLDKFRAFQIIDIAQRMAKYNNVEITGVDKKMAGAVLELKCPIRTEQKD